LTVCPEYASDTSDTFPERVTECRKDLPVVLARCLLDRLLERDRWADAPRSVVVVGPDEHAQPAGTRASVDETLALSRALVSRARRTLRTIAGQEQGDRSSQPQRPDTPEA
jgi:hypothetical protein